MGSYLGIDEVALSQGELYTILINKAGKGKKGTIVAIIKGTEAKKVCDVLLCHEDDVSKHEKLR